MSRSAFSNNGDDNNAEASGLLAKEKPGDNSQALSISEISQALKRTVEDRFGFVKLRGELSGVKRAASGHLYCSLKDEKAVMDAVMWRGTTQRLSFVPEDGLEVIVSGKVTTFPGRSKYQIVMERMEIAGEGALLALLEKTRKRLEAEGLFAPERKRALPFAPKVIGVVTSPTGAVIRDICHRLADRFPSHVLVWPVLVQGKGAAEQVAQAVRGFSEMAAGGDIPRPDLVIVARGGGSVEDLWAFNEEVVVRAIAECSIPIISAVGHETDTTLADYAADQRAPTPSAAAEMAVPVLRDLADHLDEQKLRMGRSVHRPLELGKERLQARVSRMPSLSNLLQPQIQRLDDASERLRRGLVEQAAKGRAKLSALRLTPASLQRNLRDARGKLAQARFSSALVTKPIAERGQRLVALERLRLQLDPYAPLQRGYALVSAKGHKAVSSRELAQSLDSLTLEFADGALEVVPEGASPQAAGQAPPTPPKRAIRKSPVQKKDTGDQPKLL